MTSEQNVSASIKYLNLRNDENNSRPKRIPTEGEIDQFIELLKFSNAGNTGNLEGNSKQNFSDYSERNLTSKSISTNKKSNIVSKISASEISSCVTLKEDGTLMKTIHVQSPESYLKEAERFDPEMHHEREMERDSIRSISPYSQSSDYLRKTTYLNNQSELKVTLSRDQDRSYSYHDRYMDRMSYREDNERNYNKDSLMLCKPMSSESHSRSYDYPHDRERYSHEFGNSGSFSRYSAGPTQRDVDLRRLPSISPPLNSPRSTNPGEYRHSHGGTPPPPHYSERTNMRLRANSPYRSNYYDGGGSHYGGSSHSKDIPRSSSRSRWSRSPSPPRSSRISHSSRDKQLYSPFNEDSLSDFEMQRFSPDIKHKREDRRYRRRSPSLVGIPSPPSPPPPPVLSNLKTKKREEKYRSDYERIKSKKIDDKDSVNPISTLLADRNVSISTLLEAAIGSSAGGKNSSSYSPWDSSKKAEIVSKCEEKIGQLYRHRLSGPGSFIPDPVPPSETPYVYKSPLILKHPRLEFNTRPIGNIWNCSSIVVPDPNSYKCYKADEKNNEVVCITDDEDEILPFSHSNRSLHKSNRNQKKSSKKKEHDYQKRNDNDIAQKIETRVSYGSNLLASNNDSSRAFEMEKQGLPIANIMLNDYNKSLQEQQYSTETQYASTNASYNVPPNFQQQTFVASSSTYDANIWLNSGGVGYQQPSFENQLVQYPIGHQSIGPSIPFGITNNYPMMPAHYSAPMVQYPIGQDMNRYPNSGLPGDRWFQQDEHNNIKATVETVQYPLKQRSNNDKGSSSSKNSHSKNSSHHSNLISLTGSSRCERNDKSKDLPEFNSEKIEKETSKDDSIPLDLDQSKVEKLKKFSNIIRNIQVNDNKTRDIIKDLESGPKIYSYAYLVWHRMLLKKDENKYKIYVSELGEKPVVSILHEMYHDLRETELEAIAKTVLTVIPNLQENVAHAFRLCPFCKKGAVDKNRDPARAKSPNKTVPFAVLEKCSTKNPYFRRSRSPLKRRRSYYKSPPPKKIPQKSTVSPARRSGSISKDKSDRTRSSVKNRSLSPRDSRQSQKRRHRSRSRDGRDRRRGRSGNRRSPSADRHRRSSRGRSGRSPYSKRVTKRSKRSSDVEIVDHINPQPKKIDTIDLTEDSVNETMGKFIVKSEVIDEYEIKKEKEHIVQIKVEGSKDGGDSKAKTGEASKSRKISIKFNRTQPKTNDKDNSNNTSEASTESSKSPKQKDDTSSKQKQEKDTEKEIKEQSKGQKESENSQDLNEKEKCEIKVNEEKQEQKSKSPKQKDDTSSKQKQEKDTEKEIKEQSKGQKESENSQDLNEKEKCEIKVNEEKQEQKENIVIKEISFDKKELNLEDKHLGENREENMEADERNENNLKEEENNLTEDNKNLKGEQYNLTEVKGEERNLTEGNRNMKEEERKLTEDKDIEEENTLIEAEKGFNGEEGRLTEATKDFKGEETLTEGDKDLKGEEKQIKADTKVVEEEEKNERKNNMEEKKDERNLKEDGKDTKEEERILKEGGNNLNEEENIKLGEEGIEIIEKSCLQKVAKKVNTKKKKGGKGGKEKEKFVKMDDKKAREEESNLKEDEKDIRKEEIQNLNAEERGLKKNRRITRVQKSQEMNEGRSLKKDTEEVKLEHSCVKDGKRNSLENEENVKEIDSLVTKDIGDIKTEGKEVVLAEQGEKKEEISHQKQKMDQMKECDGFEKKGESNKQNESSESVNVNIKAEENVLNEKNRNGNKNCDDKKIETVKDGENEEKVINKKPSKEHGTTADKPKDNEKKEDKESDLTKESVKVTPQMDFKSRVRMIQLDDPELKQVIECLENKTEDKNILEAGYIMKGGMLCKKCQIASNSEVRIVTSEKQLKSIVFAVHTMSANHASASKTVMLFNKHFIPMNNVDTIVETVINDCHICK